MSTPQNPCNPVPHPVIGDTGMKQHHRALTHAVLLNPQMPTGNFNTCTRHTSPHTVSLRLLLAAADVSSSAAFRPLRTTPVSAPYGSVGDDTVLRIRGVPHAPQGRVGESGGRQDGSSTGAV
ncbi:hypothetical protein GCM10018772_23060 [Streptomyces fumanus]|uniref:Uncharacterized protein n=1 Tax=Streptomyces fumanus TaxID=67302 RepID=A0A919AC29_9ACTN|nr:hypothetical protein GCM10018772_23060 [Streptomyces fumanus]